MKILKNWIVDLVLTILFITFGILLLIPAISTKIVSLLIAILLITFYILVVVPKYNKIKNISTELVTWVIIESIVIIALAVFSLVGGSGAVDLVIVSLNLNDIIGLVLILEGILTIVKLTNNEKNKILPKYLSIVFLISGTYILCVLNLNIKYISISISFLCFILSIITLIYMIKFIPKNQKIE